MQHLSSWGAACLCFQADQQLSSMKCGDLTEVWLILFLLCYELQLCCAFWTYSACCKLRAFFAQMNSKLCVHMNIFFVCVRARVTLLVPLCCADTLRWQMLPIPKDKPQISTPNRLLDLPQPNYVVRATSPLGRVGVLSPWGVLTFGGKSPIANHISPPTVQRVCCAVLKLDLMSYDFVCYDAILALIGFDHWHVIQNCLPR